MAIRQKTLVKLRVTGESAGHGRTNIEVRDLKATIDEPKERGGTNMGPTPTEYAYTALMGCTTSISNKCAKELGVDIGRLSYDMVVEFDRRGVLLMEEIDLPFPSIHLRVISHGSASPAELEKVGAETAKYCPVSKLFVAAGTKVEVVWEKA